MTVTDHETTVLDDLDFAAPCQADEECGATATLLVTVRGFPCCTKRVASCADCLAWLRAQLASGTWVTCLKHGGEARAADLRIDAVPLDPI